MEPEAWLEGCNEDSILVSMREGCVPTKSRELKVAKKNVLDSYSLPVSSGVCYITPLVLH